MAKNCVNECGCKSESCGLCSVSVIITAVCTVIFLAAAVFSGSKSVKRTFASLAGFSAGQLLFELLSKLIGGNGGNEE